MPQLVMKCYFHGNMSMHLLGFLDDWLHVLEQVHLWRFIRLVGSGGRGGWVWLPIHRHHVHRERLHRVPVVPLLLTPSASPCLLRLGGGLSGLASARQQQTQRRHQTVPQLHHHAHQRAQQQHRSAGSYGARVLSFNRRHA